VLLQATTATLIHPFLTYANYIKKAVPIVKEMAMFLRNRGGENVLEGYLIFSTSSFIRLEVLTAQNSLPHIEQWSSECASSVKLRVLSHLVFALSGSSESANCFSQSNCALA
jgi:hypothetical protein